MCVEDGMHVFSVMGVGCMGGSCMLFMILYLGCVCEFCMHVCVGNKAKG